MKCPHDQGYIFCIDYTPNRDSGCDTCGSDSSQLRINRYCKICKNQMGYKDLSYYDDSKELSRLEFTSPEMEQWWGK